jgi:5-methylcytosine-specific restriction endonuclease McrA
MLIHLLFFMPKKGTTIPREVVERMRAGMKGKKRSEQAKKNISEARKKFYRDNPEAAAKNAEHLRRTRPDKEAYARMGLKLRGDRNAMANQKSRELVGIMAKERWSKVRRADPKLRRSSAMIRWSMSVKVRDKFTCQICGAIPPTRELVADHIKPLCLHPELALELSNGRTLCKSCHLKTPTYGSKPFIGVDGHLFSDLK